MLLFGVRKDAFDGFLAPLVQVLILGRVAGVVGQFLIILPDMPLYRFGTILGVGTKLARRAAFANLRVGLVFPVSVPVGGMIG